MGRFLAPQPATQARLPQPSCDGWVPEATATMKIADRLVVSRILVTTTLVCAVLLVLMATTQLLNQATRIIDASGGWVVVLSLAALSVPGVIATLLPLAWLIGVMQAYGAMRANSETVVLMGTGKGPAFLLRPAIWLALSVAGLMLLNSVFLEPAANRKGREIIHALIHDAMSVAIKDGVLREIEPGLFVRAGPADVDGAAQGFLLYDRRQRPSEALLLGQSAQLSRDTGGASILEVLGGQMLVRELDSGAVYSARFGTFRAASDTLLTGFSTHYRPRETSTAELVALVRADGAAVDARRELLRRLTDWLYPLSFCALAAWLTIRADKNSRAWQARAGLNMATALMLGIVVKVTGLTVPQLTSGMAAAALGVLVPMGATALFTALAILESRRERRTRVEVPA